MAKRISEAYTDEEHDQLKKKKTALKEQLKLKKITWKEYFLHITGIKVLK